MNSELTFEEFLVPVETIPWTKAGKTFQIRKLTVEDRADLAEWSRDNQGPGHLKGLQCQILRACVDIFNRATDEQILAMTDPIPDLIVSCMKLNGFSGSDDEKKSESQSGT